MPFLSYSLFPSGKFLREGGIVFSTLHNQGPEQEEVVMPGQVLALWVPKVKVANSCFDGQIVAFCCSSYKCEAEVDT